MLKEFFFGIKETKKLFLIIDQKEKKRYLYHLYFNAYF